MKRVAILGASGHGKTVADAALRCGLDAVEFFDDAWPTVTSVGPWNVTGTSQELIDRAESFVGVVVAIGDNSTRLSKVNKFLHEGLRILTLVHPGAVSSSYAALGEGTVVAAGAVINAFAAVGRACIINTGATVDHDCILEDGVHVGPGAHLGGCVTVGAGAWIGIGAAVRDGITIGANSIIGAGAAVVSDVREGATVAGVPARPLWGVEGPAADS